MAILIASLFALNLKVVEEEEEEQFWILTVSDRPP